MKKMMTMGSNRSILGNLHEHLLQHLVNHYVNHYVNRGALQALRDREDLHNLKVLLAVNVDTWTTGWTRPRCGAVINQRRTGGSTAGTCSCGWWRPNLGCHMRSLANGFQAWAAKTKANVAVSVKGPSLNQSKEKAPLDVEPPSKRGDRVCLRQTEGADQGMNP